MLRARLALLSLSLLVLGCVVHTQPTQAADSGDGPKPNEDDSTRADADADADADANPQEKPERARTQPADVPACPTDADDSHYCTDDGKLAGQWVPVDTLKVPDDAEVIFEAPHMDIKEQPALTVLVSGEQLFVRQVTCGSCRRVLGQGFSGVPARLGEAQARAMQARLGLSDAVAPMTSVDAWRSFAVDQVAALDELSLRTEI